MVNILTNMMKIYGGEVVNRKEISRVERTNDFFGHFCKTKIQVYTFGMIHKRNFNVRDFFHKYLKYMYPNNISALHMVEIQYSTFSN